MKNEELVLVTNDDGFKAKGLKVLKTIAKKLSDNIWEFSPLSNNSGKSHSITINKKIKIKQLDKKVFIVNGTPVDCVIFGNKYLARKKLKPTIILSGINYGQNMGTDLLYSATVAAAREGSIQGIKSFSVSLEKNKQSSNWKTVAYFLPKILSYNTLDISYDAVVWSTINVFGRKPFNIPFFDRYTFFWNDGASSTAPPTALFIP